MTDLVTLQSELPVFVGESYEDHVSVWRQTAQELGERQWMLGAIAASLETGYGKGDMKRFAGDVGVGFSTVYEYAQVYLLRQNSARAENLTWTHYRIAARSVNPHELLQQAEDEGLTTRQMEQRANRQKGSSVISQINTTCTVADLDTLIEKGRKFGTVYADPPWSYGNQGTRAATGNHYSTMTIGEIAALPIANLVADNAHLFLWTTSSFLFECPKIFEAWGFEYKSSFVWVKPQLGLGNYFRISHEFMLVGVRGSLPFADHGLISWMLADRTRHSAKPKHVRLMIEQASPGPRLELFARRVSQGWTAWGNEIDRTMFDDDVKEVA